jgi:hypothetical protein
VRCRLIDQNGVVEIRVWVDGWQMQCCGEPFAVGEEISWTLRDADNEWLKAIFGPESAIAVDKQEEHHGGVVEGTPATAGRVTTIAAVYCRYAPPPGGDARALHPVAGSGTATPVQSADGGTNDRGDLTFVGYVVGLTL